MVIYVVAIVRSKLRKLGFAKKEQRRKTLISNRRKDKLTLGVISMNTNDDIRIPLCPMNETSSKQFKITWTRCTDLQTSFIPTHLDQESMRTNRPIVG